MRRLVYALSVVLQNSHGEAVLGCVLFNLGTLVVNT